MRWLLFLHSYAILGTGLFFILSGLAHPIWICGKITWRIGCFERDILKNSSVLSKNIHSILLDFLQRLLIFLLLRISSRLALESKLWLDVRYGASFVVESGWLRFFWFYHDVAEFNPLSIRRLSWVDIRKWFLGRCFCRNFNVEMNLLSRCHVKWVLWLISHY